MAIAHISETDRAKANLGHRGQSSVNVINESGLYKLVMRSDKPEAKKFQAWVTEVVLPAIRKADIFAKTASAYSIGSAFRKSPRWGTDLYGQYPILRTTCSQGIPQWAAIKVTQRVPTRVDNALLARIYVGTTHIGR